MKNENNLGKKESVKISNGMKKENKFAVKLFLVLLAVVFVGGAGETHALGASVSFEPATLTAKVGQQFDLAIVLNPSVGAVYTGKIQLKFPADSLEVKSFAMNGGFMPMQQSGYDLADNSGGILIKTGGYPGGFSTPIVFGKVSFLAKKTGQAIISLDTSNSLMLDALGKNTLLSGAFSATVTVLPASVQTAPTIVVPVSSETKPATEVIPEVSTTGTTEQVSATAQTAAVAVSGGNVVPVWVWILLIIIVIAIVGYGAYALGKKQRI